MDQLTLKFKNVFLSDRNLNYILEFTYKSINHIDFPTFAQKYSASLRSIQDQIFDSYYSNLGIQASNGQLDFESILIALNNLCVVELQKLVNEQPHDSQSSSSCVHYLHLYSHDCHFSSGRYTFPFHVQNLKSIYITSFQINCNIYNITELNNRFELVENEHKTQIIIPIGYYKLNELISVINTLLNENSPNKFKYTCDRHTNKNKLFIKTENVFAINFTQVEPYSLSQILGFKKNNYMNNNMYLAETTPMHDIHDNLYVRFYLDDKEITKITSTSDFNYFAFYNLNLDTNFCKNNLLIEKREDPFDMDSEMEFQNFSIEFWNSPTHHVMRKLDFNMLIACEY